MFKNLQFSKASVLEFLLYLLFFSLPLHRNFSTLFVALILLISIATQIERKLIPSLHIDWYLPILFIYYLISNLLTGGQVSEIEKRLLLIAIPILFWLNPNFLRASLKPRIYWSYVIGVLFTELICLAVALKNSISINSGHLIFNAKVFQDEQYDFLTASVRDGNYFFGDFFSLFHHPIYFGVYVVIAQLFIFEIFSTSESPLRKMLMLLLYGVQFLILFLISSRAALFGSLVLTILLFWTAKVRLYAKILVSMAVIIIGILFVRYNPKVKLLVDTIDAVTSINPNARSGHDLRILIWDASLDIIRNNWVTGVGEGNKDAALLAKYDEKGYIIPAKEKFNSHNQYLDLLIGGGLIAISLYLIGLIRLILRAWKEKLVYRPFLIFVLFFSFEVFFENLLSRHAGVLIFAVFTTYLSKSDDRFGARQ